MVEQARSEKSEKSLGAEVFVVGMATERALRHGVIRRKTSHGADGRERLSPNVVYNGRKPRVKLRPE
jgi:hypothetical protein